MKTRMLSLSKTVDSLLLEKYGNGTPQELRKYN